MIDNCQGAKMKQRRNKPVLFGNTLTKTSKHKLFEEGNLIRSPAHKFNSKPFLNFKDSITLAQTQLIEEQAFYP